MAITIETALSAHEFHHHTCARPNGTNAAGRSVRVRRTGMTKTWKRDSARFEIPVKFGLYESFRIANHNAHDWHAADQCPHGQGA